MKASTPARQKRQIFGVPGSWNPLRNPWRAFQVDGTFRQSRHLRYVGTRSVRVDTNGTRQVIAGGSKPGYSVDGGMAVNAFLNDPNTFALESAGKLFFGDCNNWVVWRSGYRRRHPGRLLRPRRRRLRRSWG